MGHDQGYTNLSGRVQSILNNRLGGSELIMNGFSKWWCQMKGTTNDDVINPKWRITEIKKY